MYKKKDNKFDKLLVIYIIVEIFFFLGFLSYKIAGLSKHTYNLGDISLGIFLLLGILAPSMMLIGEILKRKERMYELVDNPYDRDNIRKAFDLNCKEFGIKSKYDFAGVREAWRIVDEYEAKIGKKPIMQYYIKKIRNRLLIGFVNFCVVLLLFNLVSHLF